MDEKIIDLDKSRDELILKTKDFIDEYIDEIPKSYRMDFKISLANLCMEYFDHGINTCVDEACQLKETPDGDKLLSTT